MIDGTKTMIAFRTLGRISGESLGLNWDRSLDGNIDEHSTLQWDSHLNERSDQAN